MHLYQSMTWIRFQAAEATRMKDGRLLAPKNITRKDTNHEFLRADLDTDAVTIPLPGRIRTDRVTLVEEGCKECRHVASAAAEQGVPHRDCGETPPVPRAAAFTYVSPSCI